MYKMMGRDQRFVADAMLGKLAKWLRILGFDTEYRFLRSDIQIKEYLKDGRIVITRNRKWTRIEGVVCLESNHLESQIAELCRLIKIDIDDDRFFTRCPHCNIELVRIEREDAYGHVPDYILNTASEFSTCPSCRRIFWPGSHISRMSEKIEELKRIIKRGG